MTSWLWIRKLEPAIANVSVIHPYRGVRQAFPALIGSKS